MNLAEYFTEYFGAISKRVDELEKTLVDILDDAEESRRRIMELEEKVVNLERDIKAMHPAEVERDCDY